MLSLDLESSAAACALLLSPRVRGAVKEGLLVTLLVFAARATARRATRSEECG